MSDPIGPTRRIPRDRPEPPETRRSASGAAGDTAGTDDDDWIPQRLAARYSDIKVLTRGGEAEVYRVRDGDDLLVYKSYRPGIEPDEQVRTALTGVRAPGLASILTVGVEAGRHFELMEYVPGRNLADVLRDHPGGMDAAFVKALVAQATEALAFLHERDIVSLDIKPSNIIVREPDTGRPAPAAPPEFVIVDFGTASHGEHTMNRRSTVAHTLAYAAPETFGAGNVGAASDWWSLGMTALEVGWGRHPFAGMDEGTIRLSAINDDVPWPPDLDPAIDYLCRGLIVPRYQARWGLDQVRRWLAGERPPPPTDRRPPPPDRVETEFNGKRFTERAPLAYEMAENWQLAATRFFDPMAEPWFGLREWLRQFDDPGRPGSGSVIDRIERSGLPPDVDLLLLLRWLKPDLPPLYRDRQLSREEIAEMARQAAREGDSLAQQIIDDLWRHRILHVFADPPPAPYAARLTRIDDAWRRSADRWGSVADRVRRLHPETGQSLDAWPDARVRAYLLWMIAGPGNVLVLRRRVIELRDAVRRTLRQARHDRLDWYEEIVAAAHDPVTLLAAYAVSGQAQAAANRALRDAERALIHVHAWNRQERWRDLERPLALGWAAASMGVVLVGWVMLLLLSDAVDIAGTPDVTRGWIYMVITLTLQTGAELWLAGSIGAPYHPYYSLLIGMARGARATGEHFRRRAVQGLIVVLVVFAVLMAATLYVPFLLPLLLLPAHIAWVYVRYVRWEADYARRRLAALGPHGPAGRAGADGPGPIATSPASDLTGSSA